MIAYYYNYYYTFRYHKVKKTFGEMKCDVGMLIDRDVAKKSLKTRYGCQATKL